MKQEYPEHWTRTEETVPADWIKRYQQQLDKLNAAQKVLDKIKQT
jgi:hypothetical protein